MQLSYDVAAGLRIRIERLSTESEDFCISCENIKLFVLLRLLERRNPAV